MADAEQDVTDKPTLRVVLKRERVLVLPEGVRVEELVTATDEKAMMKLLGKRIGRDPYAEAWTVVGEFEGASQSKAIRAHTGEPGRSDTKAGDFKAVALKSWRGGERMIAPPQPLFRAEPLED